MTLAGADVRHALPHLAGTKPRVSEAIDQRGHDLAPTLRLAIRKHRAAQHDPQVEALDALRGPVGRQLLGADAPNLFRVSLEEDVEQAPPELVAHPVLETPRILDGLEACAGVAGQAEEAFDRAEVPQRIDRLDRICEEPATVVDARQAAPRQHLVAED